MAPDTAVTPPLDKGPLERLLAPIADVRRGEAASALLLTLIMFLLLGGYYLLKTAREVFILSGGSASVKSYASAGQALLLLLLVPAYGALAARVKRSVLITWVSFFFAGNIVLFALAARAGLSIGVPYFLWLGIYNVMVVSQFWAFANDLYTKDQGKRLFPLIGVGSSLGAWVGSLRAGYLIDASGPIRLLLGGAAVLLVCTALARIVDARSTRLPSRGSAAPPDAPVGGSQTGFGMLLSDRYLMGIALLTIFLNLVNSTGEYIFGRYVVESAAALYGAGDAGAAAREQFIGDTYSSFYGATNLLGLLLQMFAVSAIFRFLGVGRALLIHPFIAATGYLLMLRAPSFQAMRLLKTADNAVDYSLSNTTKQALWLPTSREAKYKAKQAVDSFCVRAGDVLNAAVVYTGELGALSIPAFAAVNLALTGAWLAAATSLNRRLSRDESLSGRTS
jgi:AAA family ATP:ADP antiporter